MKAALASVKKISARYAAGGTALRVARESVGVSQDVIAAALGVSRPFVGDLEAGEQVLSWERISLLPPSVRKALLAPALVAAEEECARADNDLLLLAKVSESGTVPAMARAYADGAVTRAEAAEVTAEALRDIDDLREVIARMEIPLREGTDGVRRG